MSNALKLLISTFFIGLSTFAQTKFGPNAGLQHASIQNKSDVAAGIIQNTLRSNFGLALQYDVNKKIGFTTGVAGFGAGQKYEAQLNSLDIIKSYKGEIKLNYVSVPLLINVSLLHGAKAKHVLNLGGFSSYLLNYRQTNNYTYLTTNIYKLRAEKVVYSPQAVVATGTFLNAAGADSSVDYDFSSSPSKFNRFDFGGQLGYSFVYSINKKIDFSASLFLRYGLGQVDNIDTITFISKLDPTDVRSYNIAQEYEFRGNPRPNPNVDKQRVVGSNNILAGLNFGILYNLKNN